MTTWTTRATRATRTSRVAPTAAPRETKAIEERAGVPSCGREIL